MESTLSKAVMLLHYVEFGIYGICTFIPDFVTSHYSYTKPKNMTEDTIEIMQSNIETLIQILSSVEMIMSHRISRATGKMQTCKDIPNTAKLLSLRDLNGYPYNTVSNNDLVQLQYLQLPYPPISYDTIEMEYKYYQSQSSNYPLSTQYSMKLEYLNHYLYQGKNSFEFVHIFTILYLDNNYILSIR